jgi:hypothetical protein
VSILVVVIGRDELRQSSWIKAGVERVAWDKATARIAFLKPFLDLEFEFDLTFSS